MAAPVIFESRIDAEAWLDAASWLEPDESTAPRIDPPLRTYAEAWLAVRELKPRTRAHYRRLLDRQVLPDLGDRAISTITTTVVRTWYATLPRDKPTLRAHAYALLRTLLNSAVEEEIITANPCRIRGAGVTKRVRVITPATLEELDVITAAMPERYRMLVTLSAWCALRVGEATELRRKDVDLDKGIVRIRRGVIWLGGEDIVDTPKTFTSIGDISVPPHLLPALKDHMMRFTGSGAESLLFPGRDGGHLPPSTLRGAWSAARKTGGREDLRWHDLRHVGAVLTAQTGATLVEIMGRLRHGTPNAALRYQHIAIDADARVAANLSLLAGGGQIVPFGARDRRASGA